MANTKSAIKRIRRISKQTTVNKGRNSKFKNAIKKNEFVVGFKKKERSPSIFAKTKFRINENCKDRNC